MVGSAGVLMEVPSWIEEGKCRRSTSAVSVDGPGVASDVCASVDVSLAGVSGLLLGVKILLS